MADKEITIESDAVVDHAVIASWGLMKIGSKVRLGGSPGTACDPISALVISKGEFTIGTDNTVRNAQLVTTHTAHALNLQSKNTFEGTAIQSLSDINTGSDNEFMGCALAGGGGTSGPGSGLTMRLVN